MFGELFAGFEGVVHYLSEDGGVVGEVLGESGEDLDEPGVGVMLELVRMIGTGDRGTGRWVAERGERIKREKQAGVEEWLAGAWGEMRCEWNLCL